MRDPGFGDHLVRHCAIAEPDMQMSRLETHSTAIRAIKPSSLGQSAWGLCVGSACIILSDLIANEHLAIVLLLAEAIVGGLLE